MIDDKELIERLLDWPYQGETMAGEAADRIEALIAENERLRRTIRAAGELGRIIGFLGDDEGRIAAFWEGCGPGLVNRARATLAEIKGGNDAKSDL